MEKMIYPFLFAFIIGCSTNSTEEIERTYPQAIELDTVTLQELLDSSPDNSLNIEVFINQITLESECPKDALASCIGDAIFVSNGLNPTSEDNQYPFQVNEPRQFKKGEQYTMSFKIESVGSEGGKSIELIGYSFANQIIDDF